MQYSIINTDGESYVTAIIDGEPYVAGSDHPNFEAIVGALVSGEADDSLADLFDISNAVAARFEALSDRVSVSGGSVYFDGDRVDNSLTEQVVRFLNAGVDDWMPLINFFEKVQQNPDEHSREQLYDWLTTHDFAITDDGDFVGYKGVATDDKRGYVSINSGSAVVDGEPVNGRVPNNPGNVVTMPRSAVAHDPSTGCSTGLHVGTWNYAKGFARGAVLQVHVNPRDVVSVPTDCGHRKLRTCRYEVVKVIDTPYDGPLYNTSFEESDEGWL